MPSISVIIPVHAGGEAFLECIQALKPTLGMNDEIIVVADGESDGAWREAVKWGARVLLNVQTQGPAAARNLGAQAASGDILLFIDADVVVKPDTLDLVREAFKRDAGLAALIGSYDSDPSAQSFLSQYRNLLHHFTHQHSCENAATFWGACGAIRRKIFIDSGWYDERYSRPCVEDIELGYRLNRAGYRILLRKDIQVTHLKEWTAASMLRTDVFLRAIPWTELLLSYHSFRNDLNLRVENRLSTALVFCLMASILGSAFGVSGMLVASVAISAVLVGLNARFYNLLRRKHGFLFAVSAIPWHWFFYAYSGFGFVLGVLRFGWSRIAGEQRHVVPVRVTRLPSPEKRSNAKWAKAAL